MASAKIQRMSKSGNQKTAQDRSSKASDVPEEIRCKICSKRYEDPKLLPCLHTFCKGCLEKNVEKHGGVLYCPVCPGELRSSDFTATGVDKLFSNLMVSNLLQAIDLKHGVSAKQCESCDESVLATSRCFECSDFLCNNCVEAHRRVRFTKQHRIVSVKNLSADALVKTPSCYIHSHESVKMFCKQCKEPVCRSCILNEHDDHVLVSLKQAVDDAIPKLNTLLVAARAKIPILQRKLKSVHSSKEKLESKVDDVIKDIQATSARILMAVKRREKDLYRMLRRIHDKKSDELESRETALQNELAQVLDSCEFTDELIKQESDAMVLHVSEMTYARLRGLSGSEIAEVPEIQDDEIKYTVEEKPILDELKIYGKVVSKEEKPKEAKEKANETRRGRRGRSNDTNEKESNEEKEKGAEKTVSTKEGEGSKKATVERKPSWLETLANPRALLRRLSFAGDENDGRRPGEQSGSNDHGPMNGSKDHGATNGSKDQSHKSETDARSPEQKRAEKEASKEKTQDKTDAAENSQRKRADSVSKPEKDKVENTEQQTSEQYSSPTRTHPKSQVTEPHTEEDNDPTRTPQTQNDPKSPTRNEEPSSPQDTEATYETPISNSILKHPSPDKKAGDTATPDSSQAWTVRGGSRPSGAHSLSYLPTLSILTKNRRGRPREVEIQLESPDNSIVSAQILDHKNGTYTIFYCPLTPGEHNLYVNIGGKNIKHGKKVLNFYGKFGGMGAEELFLARRALSCIRWQVTPGFVEIKNKKMTANPDL